VRRWLSAILLAAAAAALCGAQEAVPRAAEGAAGAVPRPVYFAPARSTAALDREGSALLAAMPEMLATSIAARQPIAISTSAGAARSIVTIAAVPAAGGGVSVTVSLQEEGAATAESMSQFKGGSLELAVLKGFVEDTASRFAPLLGPVAAPTAIQELMAGREFMETTREADYLAQLDTRWEFSLWMSGLLRLIDSTGMDSNGNYYFDIGLGPLIADATWFFNRDMGVQLSLYFNQTGAFDFGSNSRSHASGIFIFPGVGFVYRTVGQISAEYTVTLSAGLIYVSANQGDVRDRNNNVVIPQGSSAWSSIAPRIRISPALIWCITPAIALKGAIALDLIAPNMFPWYDSPLGDVHVLSLGLAYRL
jgi:hypothetical protein